MQCLLIKHIQELANTSQGFVSSKYFTLVSGGWQFLMNLVCILGFIQATNMEQEIAGT